MTEVVERLARRRVRRRVTVEAACACQGDQPCLFHYDQLDPRRQAEARRAAGIRDVYVDRRPPGAS